MRAELLNPFIRSFNHTIASFLNNSPQKKSVQVLSSLNHETNVHVFVGIAGDLSGTVFLSAGKENALRLAAAMTGLEFADFDDISASALQELLNITSGGAATELSQKDINIEITPPTFILGDNIDIRLIFPVISIELFVNNIAVYLNLSVKKKDGQDK